MKKVNFLLLVAGILFGSTLHAQPSEIASDQIRSGTSGFVALVDDDSFSGGTYTFKFSEPETPDADLDLYKFVGEFPIGDTENQFVPLIEVSPAFLKFNQSVETLNGSARAKVESWNLGGGVGLQIRVVEDLFKLTPRFKVEYSDFDYSVSIPGVEDSVAEFFVPDVEVWSYIPSLEAESRVEFCDCGAAVLGSSKLSYLYLDANTSNSSVADFHDSSWIWRNYLGYEHPVKSFDDHDLFLRPGIGRVDVSGGARNGFGFGNFYEFGLDILLRGSIANVFDELRTGATYVYEKEIQGWRFGFSGKFS